MLAEDKLTALCCKCWLLAMSECVEGHTWHCVPQLFWRLCAGLLQRGGSLCANIERFWGGVRVQSSACMQHLSYQAVRS